MANFFKSIVFLCSTAVVCLANAATWQNVGTLASGNLPKANCDVRLAAPTSNAGVYRYLSPVGKYQTSLELNLDFSNYTIPQLQSFFEYVPNNNWNNFYQSYQAAQQKYPYHVAKFSISILKSGNYLATSSMVNMISGSENISIGTPIPFISSHSYILTQELCL
ncbi:hypothetical protein [Acinetobacter sp. ANC 4178]|uniref:hypothetical protein n=1 Tax=Acinetobacter sp. ANC 4178 TaxID=2529839 RepID=UPI00103F5416|nr:hypothetical protein [Acinetobacter sp. ANC 4178]TCB68557.1 hypothetical protein E0H87_00995 [Acinetobacter sp. ANC 4178]